MLDGPGGLLRVPTAGEALGLAWLAVGVTAIAFVLWYSAVQALGVERTGLLTGVLPVSALRRRRAARHRRPHARPARGRGAGGRRHRRRAAEQGWRFPPRVTSLSRTVDRTQRRFLAWLTAMAALVALAQGLSGVSELTLYLTPVFLLAALLLSGRYIAEDRIVRRWRGARPRPRVRRERGRWPVLAAVPPPSRLDGRPRPQRGPPALAGA